MKATKKQRKQIIECLKIYYSLPYCKRNQWRFDKTLKYVDQQIAEGKEIVIQGAQWGGKWGNYYRMIALNSKGNYQYVEGFNPRKELL